MRWPWYLLLLLILGAIGITQREAIVAQWSVMYPSDERHRTALRLCYIEDRQFNRARAAAREACYERWLPVLAFMAWFGPPVR